MRRPLCRRFVSPFAHTIDVGQHLGNNGIQFGRDDLIQVKGGKSSDEHGVFAQRHTVGPC